MNTTEDQTRRPLRAVLVCLAIATVVTAGCGTRVERRTEASVENTFSAGASPADSAAGPSAERPAGSPSVASNAAGPVRQTQKALSAAATAPAAAGQGAPRPTGQSSPVVPEPSGRRGATPTPAAPNSSPGAVPAPGPGPAAVAVGAPVNVASVGSYSGVPGATLFPILQGTQLWVKSINSKGGLQGRPVRLAVFDDGGDPGRHRAQVQEAIESLKVVAFLGNNEVLTGRASLDYINQKRVPVVGGDTADQWYYESPMYFPQASSGDNTIRTALAAAADQFLPKGLEKLGTLVCNEAQACRDGERVFGDSAKKLGFDYIYRGRSSLAQPDFTAECLSARNAGVETLVILSGGDSVPRIAASCARQGFHPAIAIVTAMSLDSQKDDPNLDGLVSASNVFPYFQANTPATAEFQKAKADYGGKLVPGVGPATGWVSGKLFERALSTVSGPATSDAILRGLWSLKDDSLDGLTYPLTFVENQTAKPATCWFGIAIRDKAWRTVDDYTLHCL